MKVKRVLYTYALEDGLWIEYENGQKHWHSFGYIRKLFGDDEAHRMFTAATPNIFTGIWYPLPEVQ